ncbi:hypothetical protein SpCBS45565_g08454 [Spizellomyces sp. 'palustris']|nr:hypothetical protein SpCBS45565_g08454 [Spizellomyces sp. 'palustris']
MATLEPATNTGPSTDVTRSPTHYKSPSVGEGQLPPNPSDLILTRCAGWLSLIRLLILQFEDQAVLEKNLSVSQQKTLRHWTSNPSHERDAAFGNSPGILELMKCSRETCSQLSAEHDAVYKVLSSQTLPALKSLDKEVHRKMTELMEEERHRKKDKEKDELKLKQLLKNLQRTLSAGQGVVKVSPWDAGDPWLANWAVKRHLHYASHKYRSRSDNIAEIESTFGVWEKNLIKNIKSALLAYTSLHSVAATSHGATTALQNAVNALDPDREWETYRNKNLQDAASPFAFADDYPGGTDPLVQLVKEGPMLRKSKVMKKWKEKWYCVTASGWMHEFPERPRLDGEEDIKPKRHIWLRTCELGPLGMGAGGVTAEEFHLTEIRENHGLFTKKRVVYKFSTNSMSESESWWNAMAQFVPYKTQAATGTMNRRTSIASTASSLTRSNHNHLTAEEIKDAHRDQPMIGQPVAPSKLPEPVPLPPAAEPGPSGVAGPVHAAQPVPTQSAPSSAPTQAAPTQAAPTQAAPTQAAPTQAAPTHAAPTQAAPAQAAPTHPTPAQAAPTQSTPVQAQGSHIQATAQPAQPVVTSLGTVENI